MLEKRKQAYYASQAAESTEAAKVEDIKKETPKDSKEKEEAKIVNPKPVEEKKNDWISFKSHIFNSICEWEIVYKTLRYDFEQFKYHDLH